MADSPTHILCNVNDIPRNDAIGIDCGSDAFIAVNWAGEIYLYHNRCPHTGANLEWQPNDFLNYDRTYLQCSLHGAQFKPVSGECVYGPCRGQFLKPVPFTIDGEQLAIKRPPPRF